jgi:hypothetical protein
MLVDANLQLLQRAPVIRGDFAVLWIGYDREAAMEELVPVNLFDLPEDADEIPDVLALFALPLSDIFEILWGPAEPRDTDSP